MKCAEVQHKLTEDPSLGRAEEVSEHLASCSDCRDFYRNMSELDSLTRELRCQLRAPKDFHLKVLGDFQEQNDSGWFTARSIMVSFSLVALLAAMFITWDNLGNNGSLTAGMFAPSSLEAATGIPSPGGVDIAAGDAGAFVEVTVDSGDEGELILRLPPVIEIHRTETTDENTHYHAVSY